MSKKVDQLNLIDRAIQSLSIVAISLTRNIENPSVKREYDYIQGKIDGYRSCRELICGGTLLIKIDINHKVF